MKWGTSQAVGAPERRLHPSRIMIDVLVWLTWAAAPAIAGLLIFIALQHLGRGNPLERIRVVGDPDRLPGAG